MITCTTTFLSSAFSHFTSPVPLQWHFELINPVITSFKFVPRTFRVKAGKPFCICPWTNIEANKDKEPKAHEHHSLLVSCHDGLSAIFEGATDVVAAFVWVMDALLGYYYASKHKSLFFRLSADQIGDSHGWRSASRRSGRNIFSLVHPWFAGVKQSWLNFCESLLGSARSSSLTFTRDLHDNSREQRWPSDCTWYQSMQSARLPPDNRISSLTRSLRCDEVGMSHSHSYSK